MRRANQTLKLLLMMFSVLLSGSTAFALSPNAQAAIAEEAAALAPPDLARQLVKHKRELKAGALAPFQNRDPRAHSQHADGYGLLAEQLRQAVTAAIEGIRSHQPFRDVAFRLGVVSHYLVDANNPLASSASDPMEHRYFKDYLAYFDSALPRFPLTFYGLEPALERSPNLDPLMTLTLHRSRGLYPAVGKEYRRIGFALGIGRFDDRSTAFGTSSLAFSHAVTDVAQAFRFVWLRSGGGDFRHLPQAGGGLVFLPRRTLAP